MCQRNISVTEMCDRTLLASKNFYRNLHRAEMFFIESKSYAERFLQNSVRSKIHFFSRNHCRNLFKIKHTSFLGTVARFFWRVERSQRDKVGDFLHSKKFFFRLIVRVFTFLELCTFLGTNDRVTPPPLSELALKSKLGYGSKSRFQPAIFFFVFFL